MRNITDEGTILAGNVEESAFSAGGTIGKNTGVIFRPAEQVPRTKTMTVQCLNASFEAPSVEVTRVFTILPSPFEAVTANETRVKAAHMLALRTAVDTVRNYYSLPAYVWNSSIISGKTQVRDWVYHIQEIRAALQPVADKIYSYAEDFNNQPIASFEWLPLETGGSRADVMTQLQEIILSL